MRTDPGTGSPSAKLASVMRSNAKKVAANAPRKSTNDFTGDVGDYLGGPQPVPAPQARRTRSRRPRGPVGYPG